MSRFITKPNSKCDKIILLTLNLLLTMYFSWVLADLYKNIAYDNLWLIISTLLFGVLITYLTSISYWRKYSVEHTFSKLLNEVLNSNYESLVKNENATKLIDKICKATIVPIERRKLLYEDVCRIWTSEGLEIPPYITEKWKRAIVEYKKFEIWND